MRTEREILGLKKIVEVAICLWWGEVLIVCEEEKRKRVMLHTTYRVSDRYCELLADYLIYHNITDKFISVGKAMTCAFSLLTENFRQ